MGVVPAPQRLVEGGGQDRVEPNGVRVRFGHQAQPVGEGRVLARELRRKLARQGRELKEEGEVGKDDEHRAEVELQKLTDTRIGELDSALSAKEKEILEI